MHDLIFYRKFITWFLIHKFPDPWDWMKNCLNSGLNESSGLVKGYIRENSPARKHKTTQYDTAKLTQPRPNMAVPRHGDTACEQGVNRKCITWLTSRGKLFPKCTDFCSSYLRKVMFLSFLCLLFLFFLFFRMMAVIFVSLFFFFFLSGLFAAYCLHFMVVIWVFKTNN